SGEAFVGAGCVGGAFAVAGDPPAARGDREAAGECRSQVQVDAHAARQRAGRLAFVEQQRARGGDVVQMGRVGRVQDAGGACARAPVTRVSARRAGLRGRDQAAGGERYIARRDSDATQSTGHPILRSSVSVLTRDWPSRCAALSAGSGRSVAVLPPKRRERASKRASESSNAARVKSGHISSRKTSSE